LRLAAIVNTKSAAPGSHPGPAHAGRYPHHPVDSAAGIHVAAERFESATAAHPQPDFTRRIPRAFTGGDKQHPQSTFVALNADGLEPFGSFVVTIS